MSKSVLRWLDPIVIIGLVISVSISAAMVLSGNDTLSGLIIGLLSTIVTLLIDIIARFHKAEVTALQALDELQQTLQTKVPVKPLLSREALYRACCKIGSQRQ